LFQKILNISLIYCRPVPQGRGSQPFTISYHLSNPYCQRVPLLPKQLIWSNLS